MKHATYTLFDGQGLHLLWLSLLLPLVQLRELLLPVAKGYSHLVDHLQTRVMETVQRAEDSMVLVDREEILPSSSLGKPTFESYYGD